MSQPSFTMGLVFSVPHFILSSLTFCSGQLEIHAALSVIISLVFANYFIPYEEIINVMIYPTGLRDLKKSVLGY